VKENFPEREIVELISSELPMSIQKEIINLVKTCRGEEVPRRDD